MPFLGVEPVQEFASVAKQTITGTGATSYSLDHSVANANDLAVFVNNVRQEPTSAYTASGGTITFTSALASTDSCYVVYIARSFQSTQVTESDISDYNPQLKAHTVQSVSFTSTSDSFDLANATGSIIKVTISGVTISATSGPKINFSSPSSHEGKRFLIIIDYNFTGDTSAGTLGDAIFFSNTFTDNSGGIGFSNGVTYDQTAQWEIAVVGGTPYAIFQGNFNN
jgi:hypothetical protein